MLQSITWQEFLFAAALLTGVYYVIILCILNRSKRSDYLGSIHSENSDSDVMGGISDDGKRHTSSIAAERISFAAATQQGSTATETVDPLLLGSVSDLLEEAKTLTHFIVENKSTREETRTFLRTLLSKYSHLKESKYQNAIELYLFNELKDDADQKLNLEEIGALWQ